MTENFGAIETLDSKDLARLIVDMIHRLVMHHGFWFNEVRHQMGSARAMEALETAGKRSLEIQIRRLGKVLGFEVEDGLPKPLVEMDRRRQLALLEAVAANWLANDGVWFQAVEFENGMNDAKRCNDTCWAHFSPLEAWFIKKFLNLPARPGLQGLKLALGYRLYARLNVQTVIEEDHQSLVFEMNECRVQAARKKKNLPDYPCKSAGLVEYTYFARAIDDRIVTECIGCPPDDHPDRWYCAWRFRLGS